MNIEDLPEEVFDLLASKKFNELSVSEQALVSPYLSAEDYDSYHVIVNDFQLLDNSITIDSRKEEISQKQESILRRILTYRIPVYQVAGLFLLLFLSTFAISKMENGNANPEATEVQKKKEGKSLANDEYPSELIFNL